MMLLTFYLQVSNRYTSEKVAKDKNVDDVNNCINNVKLGYEMNVHSRTNI